jgi:hypothetical protein
VDGDTAQRFLAGRNEPMQDLQGEPIAQKLLLFSSGLNCFDGGTIFCTKHSPFVQEQTNTQKPKVAESWQKKAKICDV